MHSRRFLAVLNRTLEHIKAKIDIAQFSNSEKEFNFSLLIANSSLLFSLFLTSLQKYYILYLKWYCFWYKEAFMTIAKQVDLRANIKKFFDLAFSGEPVIVPRKQNKNVVIISEADFNAMEKARRNAAYLAKLDRADEQIRTGKIVVKTMEELETMAAE